MRRVLLCTLLFLLSWPAEVRPEGTGPYRIQTETVKPDGAKVPTIKAEAHYPQSPARMWEILNHLETFSTFMPRFSEVQTLGELEGREQYYVRLNLPVPLPDLWNVVSVSRDVKAGTFAWEMMAGNMTSNRGSLTLVPEGEGMLMRLEMNADPGLLLPTWIITWGARKYLPKVLTALGARLGDTKSGDTRLVPNSAAK